MAVPPVATVYHRYWPFVPPEAFTVTVPLPHTDEGVTPGLSAVVIVAMTGTRTLSQTASFKVT